MKRKLRILIACVTVIAVFFSMTAFAFATEAEITAPLKNKGNEQALTASYSYDQTTKLNDNEVGVVVPVKVTKAGVLEMKFAFTSLVKTMKAELYSDEACTNRISGSPSLYGYFQAGNTGETCFAGVSNPGTYYLKLSSNYYSYDTDVFTNSVSIDFCEWHSGDQTIKSGQTITNYNQDSVKYRDYKFKATKNGKIIISHNSNYGYHAQILNSKKKELSEEQWCDDGVGRAECQFAVEKGKTYYIRIKPNDSGTTYHKFKLVEKAVKEKSGATRKKAVKLAAKKKVNGTIAPGSKKADWYKLTLSKKKTLTITLSGEASTYVNMTVYNSKGKEIGSKYMYTKDELTVEVTNSRTYGKADKGTYYIKISRKNAKDSGIYKLSWK